MSIFNNIVNEFDIALKTLSDKKTGTERKYPPDPIEKNREELTTKLSAWTIRQWDVSKYFTKFWKIISL